MGVLYIGNQKVTPFVYKDAGNKFGATIDTFLGNVNANGVLGHATSSSDIIFTGVINVGSNVLAHKFSNTNISSISFPDLTGLTNVSSCQNMADSSAIASVSFPKLEIVSGAYALNNAFIRCASFAQISFPVLTSITGQQGASSLCNGCSNLTSVSFPELTTVSGSYALAQAFSSCTRLATLSFPKLDTVSGSLAFSNCFVGCNSLENLYFPALKTTSFGNYTDQFSSMMFFTGTTVTHTIHFPSNLETTIQGLQSYPLFGGTSGYVVLAFDLPATE